MISTFNIPQDMLNMLNGLLDKDLLKYNPEISKTDEVVVESFKGYMINKLLK